MKITAEDVLNMLEGKKNNKILRFSLCGQDLTNVNLSELSTELFKKLSFDTSTTFSQEQISKFSPDSLLQHGKSFGKSAVRLHSRGVTGKGIGIAIIDSNIARDHEVIENANVEFINTQSAGSEEEHGLTVLSALLQVAPQASVLYYADNKYDIQNRDKNIERYIYDIISRGDVSIISMSTSFRDASIRDKVYQLLEEQNITIIDSETFYKDYTYCFVNFDGEDNAEYEEAFCEPEYLTETQWNNMRKQLYDYMKEYNIKSNNLSEAIDELLGCLLSDSRNQEALRLESAKNILLCEQYEGENGVIHILKSELVEKEKIERCNNKSIEIPCGGRTFAAPGNLYKYFGTCSASYTIPQLAGLFALAKQMCSDIRFAEFIKASRKTAINMDGRYIIEPEGLIEEVERMKSDLSRSLQTKIVAIEDTKCTMDMTRSGESKNIESKLI